MGPTHIKGRVSHKDTKVGIFEHHPESVQHTKNRVNLVKVNLYFVIIFLFSHRWLCCCWQMVSGTKCSTSGPMSWERRIRSTPRLNRCLETKVGTEFLVDMHSRAAQITGPWQTHPTNSYRAAIWQTHWLSLAASLQSAFLSRQSIFKWQCDSVCFWISSPPTDAQMTFNKVLWGPFQVREYMWPWVVNCSKNK